MLRAFENARNEADLAVASAPPLRANGVFITRRRTRRFISIAREHPFLVNTHWPRGFDVRALRALRAVGASNAGRRAKLKGAGRVIIHEAKLVGSIHCVDANARMALLRSMTDLSGFERPRRYAHSAYIANHAADLAVLAVLFAHAGLGHAPAAVVTRKTRDALTVRITAGPMVLVVPFGTAPAKT